MHRTSVHVVCGKGIYCHVRDHNFVLYFVKATESELVLSTK